METMTQRNKLHNDRLQQVKDFKANGGKITHLRPGQSLTKDIKTGAWTKEDLVLLSENWRFLSTAELASLCCRTERAVINKMNVLGLKYEEVDNV